MALTVIMPRQGQSVESCILAKWHKQPGDSVATGETLFTYETDKATFEETAKADGVLLTVFCAEGDDVPCLQNVCVIGQPGESVDVAQPPAESAADTPSSVPAPEPPVRQPAIRVAVAAEAATETKVKISPRAWHLARRAGVNPVAAVPTGPHNRIIARDIDTLLASPEKLSESTLPMPAARNQIFMATQTPAADSPSAALVLPSATEVTPASPVSADHTVAMVQTAASPAGGEFIRHTNIRRLIAKSMQSSLQESAQLTLHSSFDASDVINWRTRLKEKAQALGLPAVTLGDIVLYAVSRVLPEYRALNAHYTDEGITLFSHVNLGVAVDTPRGLMVPTLFQADTLTLAQLSENVKRLAEDCRTGGVNPDALTGGTFTVTNLGALGIESFTPVINPPQTAILGVCSVVERPRTVNGQMTLYPAMGLSLTIDHRAVDGAPAARFLAALGTYLTHFTLRMAF